MAYMFMRAIVALRWLTGMGNVLESGRIVPVVSL